VKLREKSGRSDFGTAPAMLLTKAEPDRYAYIDAVRGFAFLSVLVVHCTWVTGPFSGWDVFAQGNYGVQLFFLASAITLCHSMAERRKVDRHPVLYFYTRRFFRIAPLFWLAMIFYWTCPQAMPPHWYAEWVTTDVHPSYFVLTGMFLHGWHPSTFNCIVPGGWSIAVEMNFYLFFPLIFYFLNSLKKAAVAVFVGLLLGNPALHFVFPVLRQHFDPAISDRVWEFYKYHCFPSQLTVFLIGVLGYHLLQKDLLAQLRKSRFWSAALLLFCGMILLSLLHNGQTTVVPISMFVVLALAGIIIAISGDLPWVVNPVICYIGKISYSCYLVHFAVLYTTIKLLGVHVSMNFPLYDGGHSLTNAWFALKLFALTLLFTAIISTATMHLIENPGIALGKKLIRRINRPGQIPSTVPKPPQPDLHETAAVK